MHQHSAEVVKVLVVEDLTLVGLDLCMMVESWGYTADGPYATPDDALAAIRDGDPDIAILDVNLGAGVTSAPVAAALMDAGTPFVFLTGYNTVDFDNLLKGQAPLLQKPVSEGALRDLLCEMCG